MFRSFSCTLRRRAVTGAAVLLAVLSIMAPVATARAGDTEPQPATEVVRPGDSLSKIAARSWWRAIWEANRAAISNPDLIHPGQTLVIPNPGAATGGPESLHLVDLVDVLEASGDVQHLRPSGASQLRVGDRFLGIGMLRTGAGRATVRMSDGTVARLGESSAMGFSSYTLAIADESTKRVLAVDAGDVALEPYRTPGTRSNLTVVVAGTEVDIVSRAVDVRVDDPQHARVSVYDGSVNVRKAGNRIGFVAGKGALIEKGQVSAVQLPTAPAPLAPQPIVGSDVKFVWKSVDGAKHYWLTVAADAEMRDIRFTGAVYDASEFSMRFNRKGEYYWTVDSVDERGFRSRATTVARFAVDPLFVGK